LKPQEQQQQLYQLCSGCCHTIGKGSSGLGLGFMATPSHGIESWFARIEVRKISKSAGKEKKRQKG